MFICSLFPSPWTSAKLYDYDSVNLWYFLEFCTCIEKQMINSLEGFWEVNLNGSSWNLDIRSGNISHLRGKKEVPIGFREQKLWCVKMKLNEGRLGSRGNYFYTPYGGFVRYYMHKFNISIEFDLCEIFHTLPPKAYNSLLKCSCTLCQMCQMCIVYITSTIVIESIWTILVWQYIVTKSIWLTLPLLYTFVWIVLYAKIKLYDKYWEFF